MWFVRYQRYQLSGPLPRGLGLIFVLKLTVCHTIRYTDMVNVLETVGDDPNLLDEFGEAPLCVAAHRAQGVVVEELLQRNNIKVALIL